jgi:hypothetical protein
MLGNQEQDRLVDLLVATAEVIGDQLSPNAAAYMVSDLAQYPLPMLERALASCRRELKARLSLAAILERIEDGHPAPNEAWANAIRAADEGATVVWTEQTRDAWAAALPLVQAGDKIAARPAFLEVYTRLVKEARAAHRIATYRLSLGGDVSGTGYCCARSASWRLGWRPTQRWGFRPSRRWAPCFPSSAQRRLTRQK